VLLEPGGYDPMIVPADADVEYAVNAAAFGHSSTGGDDREADRRPRRARPGDGRGAGRGRGRQGRRGGGPAGQRNPYGLAAGILTSDPDRGLALADRLQSGIVHLNDQPVHDEPQMPFGGVKDSGWGASAAAPPWTSSRS
jgi:acyl-CoA reductase-like NAD-dependent aldehyde dehydrogenase